MKQLYGMETYLKNHVLLSVLLKRSIWAEEVPRESLLQIHMPGSQSLIN